MRKPSEFAGFPDALFAHASYGPFPAVVRHVVDGDTLDVMLDVGLNTYLYRTIRLRGVDTPELNTPHGRAVRDLARIFLPPGTPCVVTTYKDAVTFGRYVADVLVLSGGTPRSLADLAAEWMRADALPLLKETP